MYVPYHIYFITYILLLRSEIWFRLILNIERDRDEEEILNIKRKRKITFLSGSVNLHRSQVLSVLLRDDGREGEWKIYLVNLCTSLRTSVVIKEV